uniref:Uncharacterized protein n=1 Tax=Kuetzingia canaliculata TaxID=228262 RepID=A0A1Z1MPF4_KUECA|nr:hypothetical protein [Kuetzingia canaliculata]ARW67973.1 hypothetical protein [Kuetzingia canaliculata]
MKDHIISRQRIDLLIISLEALNIYYNKNLIKNIKYEHNSNYYYQIMHKLVNHKSIYYSNFKEILDIIYITYLNSQQKTIKHLTKNMLSKYSDSSDSCNELKQYLRRFKFIYFKKQEYYKSTKSLDYLCKVNINEIALLNLYIILQLKNKTGLHFLIKYLYI